jgi:hypothetical protein
MVGSESQAQSPQQPEGGSKLGSFEFDVDTEHHLPNITHHFLAAAWGLVNRNALTTIPFG